MSKKKKKELRYSTIVNQRSEYLKKNKESMIGIDIGSAVLKIVQMKNHKVVRAGIKEMPDGLMNQGRILELTALSNLILSVMKENKISGGKCAISISGNEVIVRELKIPQMDEEQILVNVKHEITSYLPINQEEYCIDYKILNFVPSQDGQAGNLYIMVVAAPISLIQPYIDVLKKAKLKVEYIDVMPNIAGKLAKVITNQNSGNIGFIDFGAYATNFVLTKNGNYVLHKTVINGGSSLTTQVSQKYGIDYLEAESLKCRTNFFGNLEQSGDTQFVENYMSYIVMDIKRTMDFFKNRNNQVGLDKIYVTGGGSLLLGLMQYLRNTLNMDIQPLAEALLGLNGSADTSSTMAFLAQAIGVTFREG